MKVFERGRREVDRRRILRADDNIIGVLIELVLGHSVGKNKQNRVDTCIAISCSLTICTITNFTCLT